MPKKSKFTPEEKRDIVLQSLREDVKKSDLCRHYGIHFSDLARWTNQFMANGIEGLKSNKRKEERTISLEEFQSILNEKRQLEQTVIDLSVEVQLLKKKVNCP